VRNDHRQIDNSLDHPTAREGAPRQQIRQGNAEHGGENRRHGGREDRQNDRRAKLGIAQRFGQASW
jgi:hypothetical protein